VVCGLAPWLHERTEGHPLFLVTMVAALMEQGWVGAGTAPPDLAHLIQALAREVPQTLRQRIESRVARLTPAEQQMLETASVVGGEFSAAAVAAGLEQDVVAVEALCEGLARRGDVVQAHGTTVWPDGTVAAGYRFVHALHQEVVYARLPAARRARLHQRIGIREEATYGAQARERAAHLAVHFVRGHDAQRAVPYLRQAAENALERWAHQEAVTHLTQALAVLETPPESPERTAHELAVRVTLGPALIVTRGQVAPDVERTYARAWELCQHLEETPQLAPVLHGLMSFYVNQGALDRARTLAEQPLRIAQRQTDPALRLMAHTSLGLNLYQAGDFVAARTHLEQGLALDPRSPAQGAVLRHEVVDYGVLGLTHLARTLWKLGYPDQACQRSQEALRPAQQLAHPHSLGLACRWTAAFEKLRGDEPRSPVAAAGQPGCHPPITGADPQLVYRRL
jgi:predicted ATPase